MSQQKTTKRLQSLHESWSGEAVMSILPLGRTASHRQYFRIQSATRQCIGAYGPDKRENDAFVHFTKHFHQLGLPVPELYAEDLGNQIYLQEDLGKTTLFHFLKKVHDGKFNDEVISLYQKTLKGLAQVQIKGGEGLDYSKCYPRAAFDRQSIQWDLNSFKYFFLRLANIVFDEQALENDFKTLTNYLLEADAHYFMYRDFQARNVMIKNGEPYFIDYQGGRKGALQYDVASLLFQPKAAIPFDVREALAAYYLEVVGSMIPVDGQAFIDHFYAFVLVRRIQAFGTYGLRGLHERRSYFMNSLPAALQDIKWVLDNKTLPIQLPELRRVLYAAIRDSRFQPEDTGSDTDHQKNRFLTVRINSFSYKYGIPEDPSGNGGGFVFDCRFIHNPGRYEPYKKLTGRDQPVIDFLLANSNMPDYLNNVYHIVDEAVENYLERGFANLMVNFGCTGGQHRSVYAADQLAGHLKQKYGVTIALQHIRQEEKGWVN